MSRVLPILFNTDMVRAILDGRKTVTRRLPSKRIEEKYLNYEEWVGMVAPPGSTSLTEKQFYEQYPPYQPGDILYVRETWNTYCEGCLSKNLESVLGSTCAHSCGENRNGYYYRATNKNHNNWRPSIHMPKEAARIWLKVTDVRVERLQDMKHDDYEKEGLENFCKKCSALFGNCDTCLNYEGIEGDFKEIWNSTLKKSDIDRYGWEASPWVWVIEFERCEKPEREG